MEEAKKTAAEAKAKRRRTVLFVGQRGVVDREFVESFRELLILAGIHRVDGREHDLAGFLVAGNRLVRRAVPQRDRVADLNLLHALDAGHNVPHLAGAELLARLELKLVVADFIHLEVALGVHEVNLVARFERSLHYAALQDHAAKLVEVCIEHQRLQRSVRIALRSRQLPDDALQDLLDVGAFLRGNQNGTERVEPQFRVNRFLCPLDIRGR